MRPETEGLQVSADRGRGRRSRHLRPGAGAPRAARRAKARPRPPRRCGRRPPASSTTAPSAIGMMASARAAAAVPHHRQRRCRAARRRSGNAHHQARRGPAREGRDRRAGRGHRARCGSCLPRSIRAASSARRGCRSETTRSSRSAPTREPMSRSAAAAARQSRCLPCCTAPKGPSCRSCATTASRRVGSASASCRAATPRSSEGLNEGDLVVARAGAFLREGDRVRGRSWPDDAGQHRPRYALSRESTPSRAVVAHRGLDKPREWRTPATPSRAPEWRGSTSVLPSDQAAPGTRCASAMTSSKARSIHVAVVIGQRERRLQLDRMDCRAPATRLSTLCSLNSGMVMS